MKCCKNRISLLIALLLCCMWPVAAFAAHEVPDLTRQGSLRVSVRDTESGKAVSGGELTLYEVAYVQEDDGDYTFIYTDGFAPSGLSLADLTGGALAGDLAAFAKEKALPGITLSVDEEGNAVFPALDLGLYLLVQTQAAENYTTLNPFLVTIPLHEEGMEGYVYDVDASPKTGTVTYVPPTPPPTPPTPPSEDLPQTGQLWWPVPVLTLCGMTCIIGGLIRRKHQNG